MLLDYADFRVPLNRPFAEINPCRTMQAPICLSGQKPLPGQSCHLHLPDKVPFGTALVPSLIPRTDRMGNLQLFSINDVP
jgi:hypothetical protein